ncbi:hypothetical protein HDE68_004536 [Pedobacter cryoconitis]|uniref:Uncharacterized protein n=1 Tax=Pedobacter cryoconitis TaxID=188932 RepID=A0A7W9E1T5_9SPHI|nr:hypothetical protein [Pedobacter cryoconitis]MBB5638604.1 hypothetical protein [Pedobacter cryoconitis]
MKKYILLLLSITAIGLSSCKKETILPLSNATILKYIAPGDWVLSADNRTLSVDIPVNEINKATFDNDEVAASISRLNNDLYDKMPFVDNGQSYSYTYEPGFITVYLQNSGNQNTPVRPVATARLKIVLITSSL